MTSELFKLRWILPGLKTSMIFVPNQSFELLFAFGAQWDSWVSWLRDGSRKWFSCFREWLLTISPGSAAESNSWDTGFSQQLLLFGLSPSGAELLLPVLCQHRLEPALQRCQSGFAWQFLLLFSPGSEHCPGAVSTVWSTAGWALLKAVWAPLSEGQGHPFTPLWNFSMLLPLKAAPQPPPSLFLSSLLLHNVPPL